MQEMQKNKIERAYQLLESGQPFEQVASTISEDEKTARNGGYIGFFWDQSLRCQL